MANPGRQFSVITVLRGHTQVIAMSFLEEPKYSVHGKELINEIEPVFYFSHV
jgi:hypothetical protein